MSIYKSDKDQWLIVSSRIAWTILGAWTVMVIAQVIRVYINYPMF